MPKVEKRLKPAQGAAHLFPPLPQPSPTAKRSSPSPHCSSRAPWRQWRAPPPLSSMTRRESRIRTPPGLPRAQAAPFSPRPSLFPLCRTQPSRRRSACCRRRGHWAPLTELPCPAAARPTSSSIPAVYRHRAPSTAPNRSEPPSRPRRRHRRIRHPPAPVAITAYTATITVSARVSRPFSPSGLSLRLPRRHSRAPPPPALKMASTPAAMARSGR